MNTDKKQKLNFWKTLSQYIGGYKFRIFVSVIFSLLTGIMVAAQPLIIKYIVDDGISNTAASADMRVRIVVFFCGVYVLISFLRIFLWAIAANSMYNVLEGTLTNLRNAFFTSVQNLSMSFYDKTSSGELYNCIMGSPMANIKTYLSSVIISVPYQSVSFIISITALLSYDWLLTVILVAVTLVMVAFNLASRKKVKSIAKDYISTENQASKYINDMFHGLEATKLYSVENDTIYKFRRYTDQIRKKGIDMSFSVMIEHTKPEFMQYLGTAVIYIAGALLCIYRGLSTGVLFAFISSMSIILTTISSFLQIGLTKSSAEAGLDKIMKVINTASETPEVKENRKRNVEIERNSSQDKNKPCIEFEHVSFGYDDKKIYTDFNCKINYNESVGLVGGSGSGKSEYAENWLTGRNKKDGTYIYIATMQPYTEETMKKIERHHRLRAGKGFRTLEKYTDLSELEIPKNQGILLECISNLVANELYREDGTLNDLKETKEKVLAGVRRLSNSTTRRVIVTNEVNADINSYSEETEKYRECIGMVNQSLAELADIVTEVVYGIPVCIRKEQKKYEEYKKNME